MDMVFIWELMKPQACVQLLQVFREEMILLEHIAVHYCDCCVQFGFNHSP